MKKVMKKIKGIQIIVLEDGIEKVNVVNPKTLILGAYESEVESTLMVCGGATDLEDLFRDISQKVSRTVTRLRELEQKEQHPNACHYKGNYQS